jgi:hypothetical protein
MSAISDLAQTFEQSAKQQASDTTRAVASALEKHEGDLKRELGLSVKSLLDAIQRHESSLSERLSQSGRITAKLVLKTWAWLALSITLVLSASFGALWWTGQQIEQNLQALADQERALAQAPQGAEFVRDKNGLFLILPKGMKATPGWTFKTLPAVKLEAGK